MHRTTLRCAPGYSVAVAFFFGLTTNCATAEREKSPADSNGKQYASSMSVIPPVPISNRIEFEPRVSVRNLTTKNAQFELSLSIKLANGETRPLWGTPLEVKANGQELVARHFASAGYTGKCWIEYQLSGPNGYTERGGWPLEVVACETRSLPLLQIAWIDPGAVLPGNVSSKSLHKEVTEQDVRRAIDAYHALGMTALIITYPEAIYSGGGVYYPSRTFADYGSSVKFDVVGTVLNQASKNGQKVFVGLGRGPDLLLTWTGFDDPQRIQASLAHSMKTATELWSLYSHESSFYGWYLTHEANDIAQASSAYYNPMVDFLHSFHADKPVMISPSGTPILSREILAASKVDIFAYQDAVGSGYVPYQNTFDPSRRISMLEDVYSTYAAAHHDSGKHLWTNLEIWQMDGPEYNNSYAPKFDRVKSQLDIEKKHVDVITTYQVFGYMDSPDSEVAFGGQKAVDLFLGYQDYHRATARKLGLIKP